MSDGDETTPLPRRTNPLAWTASHLLRIADSLDAIRDSFDEHVGENRDDFRELRREVSEMRSDAARTLAIVEGLARDSFRRDITPPMGTQVPVDETAMLAKIAANTIKTLHRLWPLIVVAGGVALGWGKTVYDWIKDRVHFGGG